MGSILNISEEEIIEMVEKILNVFCQHGASTAILSDAHPHIGTDRLPKVIEAMRNTIINCGGEVHFQTRMTRLILEGNTLVGCIADKDHITEASESELRPVYKENDDKHYDIERHLVYAERKSQF